jgi:hypothetical protein
MRQQTRPLKEPAEKVVQDIRRATRKAARCAGAAAGNGNHRISRRRFAGGGVLFSHPAAGPPTRRMAT